MDVKFKPLSEVSIDPREPPMLATQKYEWAGGAPLPEAYLRRHRYLSWQLWYSFKGSKWLKKEKLPNHIYGNQMLWSGWASFWNRWDKIYLYEQLFAALRKRGSLFKFLFKKLQKFHQLNNNKLQTKIYYIDTASGVIYNKQKCSSVDLSWELMRIADLQELWQLLFPADWGPDDTTLGFIWNYWEIIEKPVGIRNKKSTKQSVAADRNQRRSFQRIKEKYHL